jgi:hypothetical protein
LRNYRVPHAPQQHHAPDGVLGERERADRRADLVFRKASIPQSVQESGYPMSHLLRLGFNTPRFPIPAGQDIEMAPSA